MMSAYDVLKYGGGGGGAVGLGQKKLPSKHPVLLGLMHQ